MYVLLFPCTKNKPISVCVYTCIHKHMAFCVSVWHGNRLHMRVENCKKPFNASNNQLTIVCAFLYTETCSFHGFQTRTHEHFHWSKWRMHYSFPSLAHVSGGILVPDPATVHCGRSCNRASVAKTHACMFIHTRMHANSNTETITHMHGLHDGEILFTWWTLSFNYIVAN